jgi:DNA (cytosine-5)-methyltransferase 1
MKVVSLFSGALGLDLGLEKAGFKLAVAVECDPVAAQTIRLNRPRLPLIEDRLENISTRQILKKAGIKRGDGFIVVGGPSCQAFSTAGRRASVQDPRGAMFREFIRVVRESRPRFFVMENVRGLLSAAIEHRPLNKRGPGNRRLSPRERLGSAFKLVTRELRRLNYYVTFDLLNAADYGVPQVRQRLIFLGSRDGEQVCLPPPTHGANDAEGRKKWVTLRDAIGGVQDRRPTYLPFHSEREQLFRLVPEGGNWRNLPKSKQRIAIGAAYDSWGGRNGFLRRLSWEKPSPALMTMPDGGATCLGHPSEHRPLSLEEYRRIQQFPESWQFAGTLRQQYRQIGNAVPIGLGEAVGMAIRSTMRSRRKPIPRCAIECRNVDLLKRLNRTKTTVLNPPRMRNNPDVAAVRKWLKDLPRERSDGHAYASAGLRALL